jgi:CheY-like chemotaxis protein
VHRPAIIFLDIGMPGMDGSAIAAEVRRERFQDVSLDRLGPGSGRRRSEEAGFNRQAACPARIQAVPGSIARRRSER